MNLKNSAENVGRVGHERIGSEFLHSLGFNPSVCQLVESHVAAKRYSLSVLGLSFRASLYVLYALGTNTHGADTSRRSMTRTMIRYHRLRRNRSNFRGVHSREQSLLLLTRIRCVMRWLHCGFGTMLLRFQVLRIPRPVHGNI